MAYAGHVGDMTLMELKRGALRAKEHYEGIKANKESAKVNALDAGAVFGSALIFGIANGKVGGGGLRVPVIGSPADLTFGLAVHAAMFLGSEKFGHSKNAGLYRALANGALGSYASTLGAQIGNAWKLRGGGISGLLSGIQGDGSTTGGGSLADEELARMVRPAT